MKPGAKFLLLAGVLWSFGWLAHPASAQDQEVIAAVKKGAEELTAADKAVVAARNALQSAKRSLNAEQFGTPAYNARITTQQVEATKKQYDEAAPEKKEEALESYELAQELAAQRKTEFENAQNALPQKEADAKAAEEKYGVALTTALDLANQIKTLVRQAESNAQTSLENFKVATENAAVGKATAEQQAAANVQISKSLADFLAADTALQQATAALKQATDADRPQKQAEAEKALKAAVLALHAAAVHLPALTAGEPPLEILKSTSKLVEADRNLQKANAALEQAKKDVQDKTNAVTQAENRVKAAQESLEKRIAKVRGRKDLEREQQATERAKTAKQEAEAALPQKTTEAEQAQQAYAAAMAEAVKALVSSPELEQPLQAAREAFAKLIADKEAAMKAENEALAKAAAEAQTAAEQAQAALTAADKSLADRVAVRESLDKILRQRFLRDASVAVEDMRRVEAALAVANRDLQGKVAAVNRAVAAIKPLQDAAAKAREQVKAPTAALAAATQAKDAADKVAQEKIAAKAAADQAAKDALAAATAAQDMLAQVTEADKAAAEKDAQDKAAAAKAAEQKASEAQPPVDAAQAEVAKAVAAVQAAQKAVDASNQAVKAAEQKVAEAQAVIDKATAEKDAVEKVVNQHRDELAVAPGKLAVIRASADGGLKPLADAEWDYAKARHLLVRAGFGGTPDEVAHLHSLGLYGAVRHLVNFKDQPTPNLEFDANPKDRPENYESGLTGDTQRRMREARVARDRQQIQKMREWWLRRMIESPRPLEEKLTLFWHGHFASQYNDVGDSYAMYLQNQLFRDNAAGNFATLLYGIAHDAAMLKYLNNDTNVKGRANENLAREIMELFSMGRDQGYSETDIRQGARALTGFTYDTWTGQFRFISTNHDTEPKKIFGKEGNWSGDDFVKLILDTPYPAKFIARQMFVYFAHEEPSTDTVESLANVLRHNNYELAPMLENLFLSEEFYSARSVGTQVKGPIQLVVGLHRDLGLKDADLAYLNTATRDMGQELFEPPSVFGWQAGLSWVSTSRTFGRYNALAEILERRPRAGKAGVDVVGAVLAGKTFENHAQVVDYLIKSCVNVPLAESKRQALIEFAAPLPPPAEWAASPNPVNARLTRMLVMLMCSPEYQLN